MIFMKLGTAMGTDKKGFTAVELLISLAILSLALGSIYSLCMSFIKMSTSEGVKTKVQQNVRSSLDMVARDIRMAGLDPRGTGIFGITTALPQRIRFTADRDMDGELDDPDETDGIDETDLEQIEYSYDGSDLLEMLLYKADGDLVVRDKLVDDVSNLAFQYYDTDGQTTSDPDEVRTVEIMMTIRKPAGRAGDISRTLVKRVQCRNLDFH